ncbi:MAG: class I poly(R)-hydroxyalkanoic acid synthase, partial [Stellaceae bacterium]
MTETGDGKEGLPDPAELSRQFADIAERSQRIVADFLKRQGSDDTPVGMAAPTAIGTAFFEMTARLMADPVRLVETQLSLWKDYMALWQRTTERLMGGSAEPLIAASAEDRRFRDKAWSDNAVFDFIKQSYLLT